MKKISFILLTLIIFIGVLGCNGEKTISDPPEFVEMYLNEDSEITSLKGNVYTGLTEFADITDTTNTTETTTSENIYEGDLYSENDFEVVIITNGANYDLLYSVEITDSILGDCVYTDQSTLYVASSTITVETDGSYTTEIVLTVPGSANLETYLSERTISLTKILFSRDMVDGTFAADIPDNLTTSLLFQIYALNYFDVNLGLPLSVDGDNVDIILGPGFPYYDDAVTLGKTDIVIPETINGYEVGKVLLMDLDWVTNLEINGGNQDIFVLGDFSSLELLLVNGPEFVSLTTFKQLTINGDFQLLTTINIDNLSRYSVYLSENANTENDTYLDYVTNAETLYDFPVLETLDIRNSVLNYFQVGADNLDLPFPNLTIVEIDSTTISNSALLGNEENEFDKLDMVNFVDSNIGTITVTGTKPITETKATLTIDNTTVSYTVFVKGSVYSTLTFADSVLGDVEIQGGTINDSVLSDLSFSTTTFEGSNRTIYIKGSHPSLEYLTLGGISLNQIIIGSVGSVFASLTDLMISDVNASIIKIGDRDVEFSALEHLSLTNVDCSGNIFISGETADFSLLQDITLTNVSANNLYLGQVSEDFSSVTAIICSNLDIVDSFNIGGGLDLTLLEVIVLENVTCAYANLFPGFATYDLYIDNLEATNIGIGTPACQKIYLAETDITTWDFYDYATGESIPMETGVYSPS
ncbi:MAG: hypothetical protein KJ971_04965 [Firmicutes bacterium]|nr:hypothetical protein [Bacillota bacterium]